MRLYTNKGSDSSGGAGIEADLKTFTVHGCYGMTCITGLTAQNTKGVKQIYPVESQEMIENTLDAVFSDVGVDVVKTGMLTSKATVETVARKLKQYHDKKPIVVDPVMVSTSGSNLIGEDALEIYVTELLPMATVVTPNINEAAEIVKHISSDPSDAIRKVGSVEDMKRIAKHIREGLKCDAVLLKGGHAGMDDDLNLADPSKATKVVDVLYNGKFHIFTSKYINSTSTHGTGCTLASAIASNLANGETIESATQLAVRFVQRAIANAIPLGKGNGPVNHVFNIHTRPFVLGHFVEYLLSHPKVASIWDRYVNHPFTVQLAQHTLPLHKFLYFLKQDYLYLKHYSRAYSLAGFKTEDPQAMLNSAQVVSTIARESELHLDYCKMFGLEKGDLLASEEGQACYAYTRYILDVGSREDWLGLQVALSPCLFGYLEAAENRIKDPHSVREGNLYWKWVENYASAEFKESSKQGHQLLETHVADVSPQRVEQLVDIFATATKMEIAFWDAALAHEDK